MKRYLRCLLPVVLALFTFGAMTSVMPQSVSAFGNWDWPKKSPPSDPGPTTPAPSGVPEINPAAATGALTLLVSGMAMFYQPRRKTA